MEAIRRVCYALTSSGNDLYEQMTCVSVSLSRRLYPESNIVVLVDEVTRDNLVKCNSPVLTLASRIVCLETKLPQAAARSRFVKTSMRQALAGDFVFLDADALPIRKFDEIAQPDAMMAAALDLDELTDRPHMPEFASENLRMCGYSEPIKHYFNSGVIYMADNHRTRTLGQEWHTRWRKIYDMTGDHRDQASFNSALAALELPVQVLPEAFNATVYISPWKARQAKILHYWMNASNGQPPSNTLLAHLLKVWAATGMVDWDAVERARERPLAFNTRREILMPLLGPRGRVPRKWLYAAAKRFKS